MRRPKLPPVEAWAPVAGIALLYGVAVAWELAPIWPVLTTDILGDADTDAVRGMWGLDHLRRSLLPPDTPLWSTELNYPHGVLALVLPWVSGLLTAPLGWLVGPIAGFNLTVAVLLWAAGMATAVLVRVLSGSWVAGGVAGGAMLAQPIVLHSVCDGTPEHVAIWLVPAFFAACIALIRHPSRPLAVAASLLAVLVVLDSPYHGVYTALIAMFALPGQLLPPWPRPRRHAAVRAFPVALLIVGLGAAAVVVLFRAFPIESSSPTESLRLLRMNAADLHTWWQYDFGNRTSRDPSLAPTAIPAVVLWPALLFAVMGLPRSLPWLAAGLLTLGLSFGLNPRIPEELAVWTGPQGAELGRSLLRWNAWAAELPGIGAVRFPRRWLVPAALCFTVAGAIGLGAVLKQLGRWRSVRKALLVVGPLLVVGTTVASVRAGVHTARIDADFPHHTLPDVVFAKWIRDHDATGAAVLLPQRRPAPKSGKRADLPVFADISEHLSSSDTQYLQVRMSRPLLSYPSLKTLTPMRQDNDIESILRNWDDIALPQLSGRDIPSSAIDPRFAPQRQRVIAGLRHDGLRFIVVDEAAYGDSGLDHLRSQLEDHLADTQHFDDGTGVTVFVLASP